MTLRPSSLLAQVGALERHRRRRGRGRRARGRRGRLRDHAPVLLPRETDGERRSRDRGQGDRGLGRAHRCAVLESHVQRRRRHWWNHSVGLS